MDHSRSFIVLVVGTPPSVMHDRVGAGYLTAGGNGDVVSLYP